MRKELELLVEEVIPGHFYWMVLGPEMSGEPRRVVAYSQGPSPTHQQATDAGVAAVLWHSDPTRPARPVDFAKTIRVGRDTDFASL